MLDTPSLELTDPSLGGHWPGLSAGPDGAWGVTYTRFVHEPRYGSNRVFLRAVAPK